MNEVGLSAISIWSAPIQVPSTLEQEVALIERVCAGETQLFYELISPYQRSVYLAAISVLRNEADAEEAAQEAFLKALVHLNSFRKEARFSTWLIQIAINEARSKRRKDRKTLYESIDEKDQGEKGDYYPKDFADWREIPSEALQRAELRQALRDALSSLDPAHREVFVMRDIQHLSIAETAEVLQISHALVKTRLLRARLRLRDALAPRIDGAWNIRDGSWKKVRPGNVAAIEISCVEVWREVSNYIDDAVDRELRERMEEHFKGCERCTAVLDGIRNVVSLVGDGRAFDMPAGFSDRLRASLARKPGNKD